MVLEGLHKFGGLFHVFLASVFQRDGIFTPNVWRTDFRSADFCTFFVLRADFRADDRCANFGADSSQIFLQHFGA